MIGKAATRRLVSLALGAAAATLAAASSATPQASPKAAPSQKDISRELADLERDDQKDQNDPTWNESNDQKFLLRQKQRRDRVIEIVSAGSLGSMEDFSHAALLLQHGQSADDYLLAHVLAIPAGKAAQPGARFMSAATLDRFLQNVGKAQIFSTQSSSPDPAQQILMEPFDDSMSETIRSAFDLPALKRESAPKDEKRAKAPSAKELPRLLKAAEAQKPAGASAAGKLADAPEWLCTAREIVAAGALKSKQDFFLAAQVLQHSAAESDLLQAHVLAMAAAFQGHEQGLASCASTLDRYLTTIGRPQRFGTVEGAVPATPTATPPAPLHEVVLGAYGLVKEKKPSGQGEGRKQ